jgi:hypoxanthine phosphoribosyltransferase
LRRGAAKVKLCVLLKRVASQGNTAIEADFAGFAIGSEFVVGYGLDHAGQYRHLPDLAAVK